MSNKQVTIETQAPANTTTMFATLQAISTGLDGFIKKNDLPVPDCTTDAGLEEAKRLQGLFSEQRINAESLHKKVKSFYLNNGRLVDGLKKEIVEKIKPVETKYTTAIDAEKQRLTNIENERLAKIAADEAAMQARFDSIDNARNAFDLDSVLEAIDKLNNLNLQDYGERSDEALALAEDVLAFLANRKLELEKQAANNAELEEFRKQVAANKAEEEPPAGPTSSQQSKPVTAPSSDAEKLKRWVDSIPDIPKVEPGTEAAFLAESFTELCLQMKEKATQLHEATTEAA